MLKCPCPEAFVSVNRHHYKPTTFDYYAGRAQQTPQIDEALISGHFRTHLLVNGLQLKSKIWPKTALNVEEYKDFLKRLECCKKDIHRLYFHCPEVNINVIDEIIRDLEKSVYQHDYSPNEFASRKETLRYAKMTNAPTNMKYYETTYGTYYNRIRELERFMDVVYCTLHKDNKEELKSELKKIYKLGITTYRNDICIPAVEIFKSYVNPGPIDRYTLRRV